MSTTVDIVASSLYSYIQGYNTNWATARSTSHAAFDNGNINIGRRFASPNYWCYRGLFAFDTSVIGADKIVTQVNLKVCGFGTQTLYSPLQIVEYDWSQLTLSNVSDREICYDNILAANDFITFWDSGAFNNNQKTSPNLTTAYVKTEGLTTYAMRSKNDYDDISAPVAAEYNTIRGAFDATAAYHPVLSVTYDEGTPPQSKTKPHYQVGRMNSPYRVGRIN